MNDLVPIGSIKQQTSTTNFKDMITSYRDAVYTQAAAVDNEEILALYDHVKNAIPLEFGIRLESQSEN